MSPDNRSAHSLPLLENAAASVVDPVCGMTVEPSTAAGSHTHAGTTYHFCGRHCLEKFRANPEKFTGAVIPETKHSCCGGAAAPAVGPSRPLPAPAAAGTK